MCFLWLSLFLLFATVAHAETRYVLNGAGGSGCSNGSTNYDTASKTCGGGSATVYLTISACKNAWGTTAGAGAGHTCQVEDTGTYTEELSDSWSGGTSWAAPFTLTVRSGITVTVQPPVSSLRCATIGSSTGTQNHQYIIIDQINCNNVNGSSDGYKIGGAGLGHHIRLQDLEIQNANQNQGVLVGGTGSELLRLKIHDNGGDVNQDHGIYLTGSNHIIERCEVYSNYSTGIHAYSTPGGVNNNIIRYNVVYDNGVGGGGAAILASSGSGNSVYGNIVYLTGSGAASTQNVNGIVVWNASNTTVYNNTVYNFNNTTYGRGIVVDSNATTTTLINNVAASNRVNLLDLATSTWTTNHCSSAGTNCATSGDPLFVAPGSANFSLQSSSPMINTGTNIAGIPRNAACHANAAIGAYQPICIVSAEIGAIANTTLVVNIGNDAFPGTLPTSSCSAGWSVDYDAVPATISTVTCPSAGSNQIRLNMQSAPASSAVAVTVSYDASTGATTDNSNFGNQAVNQELFSTTDFAVTNTVGGTPPSQNLIAAYGLNEGTGTTTDDETGNALNGTITGAAWTGSGVSGDSLTFDGSGDDVTVADDDLLDLSNSFTVAAWVYPTTANTDFRAIAVKNYKIFLYASSSGYCAAGGVLGGFIGAGGTRTACYATPLTTDTWTYVAMTYDGADLKLYTGAASAMTLRTTTSIVDAASPSTGSLQIGASQFGEVFQGRIDEVRIWNYARSEVQLETDMDDPISGITPPTQPLLTQTNYRFDCPGGTADSPDCSYAQNQPVTIPPGKCTRVRAGFTNTVADYGSTGLGLYFQKNGTGGYSALADGPCGATSICYINGTGKPLAGLVTGNVTAQLIPSDPNFVGGGTLLTATEIPSIPFTNGKNGENVAAICAGSSTVAGTDYFELEFRAPNNTSIAINNRPRINIGGYKTSIGAP